MSTEESYQVLYDYLNTMGTLTEEEMQELRKHFQPKLYKKGEYVVKQGQPVNYVHFITSGFLRDYMIDLEGNEVTIYLSRKHDFIGALTSFLKRQSSEENIHAVTDTEVLEISYEGLMHLYTSSHTWALVGLHIMEDIFVQSKKKMNSFIKKTAEERYMFLVENEKEVLQNVPNIYIASYIGVKPETLSRIRGRILAGD